MYEILCDIIGSTQTMKRIIILQQPVYFNINFLSNKCLAIFFIKCLDIK